MLRFLISTTINKLKILRFFYQYKHFNSENLTGLSYIDLITYRIRIVFDIKPVSIKSQKR